MTKSHPDFYIKRGKTFSKRYQKLPERMKEEHGRAFHRFKTGRMSSEEWTSHMKDFWDRVQELEKPPFKKTRVKKRKKEIKKSLKKK